tara:strand:- start:16343 stop:16618 length:276 start_codon:yes stop_codon:yes gene_type:complete
MTALAFIDIGLGLFRHRIIEIFGQKVFFDRKVASFCIGQMDIAIAPNDDFLVFVRVVLIGQFPVVLQQFPQLCQICFHPGLIKQMQGIDGT